MGRGKRTNPKCVAKEFAAQKSENCNYVFLITCSFPLTLIHTFSPKTVSMSAGKLCTEN